MFCLKVGLSYLVKEFGSCDISRTPSKKERKVIDSLSSILRDAVYDNLIIDCEEESRVEEDERDPKWIADDEDTPARKGNGSVRFGDVEISEEKVKETIEYYRSTNKNSRPLSSMRSRSRSIESKHHLEKLRRLEKEMENSKEVMLLKLRTSPYVTVISVKWLSKLTRTSRCSKILRQAIDGYKSCDIVAYFSHCSLSSKIQRGIFFVHIASLVLRMSWPPDTIWLISMDILFIAVYLQAHHFFDCAQISVVVNQCLIYGPKLWEIFVTSEKLW
ncbi:hypothetical protein Y032_0005g2290 [Ancylostoma ceylanicum]|uniref:Uncharacterized protein n=1 Tax=Ancylostoma ceylanicum TaxID=53326 RepID=A0A016VSU1_9BILA|nr:hypothetical protein Y032_0005g2290 [Ancylostoma ceylanicum]